MTRRRNASNARQRTFVVSRIVTRQTTFTCMDDAQIASNAILTRV
jgi:hypothetical protein